MALSAAAKSTYRKIISLRLNKILGQEEALKKRVPRAAPTRRERRREGTPAFQVAAERPDLGCKVA